MSEFSVLRPAPAPPAKTSGGWCQELRFEFWRLGLRDEWAECEVEGSPEAEAEPDPRLEPGGEPDARVVPKKSCWECWEGPGELAKCECECEWEVGSNMLVPALALALGVRDGAPRASGEYVADAEDVDADAEAEPAAEEMLGECWRACPTPKSEDPSKVPSPRSLLPVPAGPAKASKPICRPS